MDCYKPLRIRNQYTGKYLHVNCRSCDACLIKSANVKAQQLSVTLQKYQYKYFATLTYDNYHIPYIVKGYPYIFRYRSADDIDISTGEVLSDNFLPEVLDVIPQQLNWNIKYQKLTNHPVKGAIGVLYYKDVQDWLKRFRKYICKYYGKRQFKYFAVGEYGTKFGRNHFHVVIMSNELTFEECQTASFQTWRFHDWDRFWSVDETGHRINKAFKRCNENCAGYISSYVNCNSNNVPISLYKCFSQKTCRSKGFDFGLDEKVFDDYKKDVVRISSNVVSDGERKVFYYLHKSEINNVSYRIVPTRYIYAFFARFKGFNEMDFNAKLSRAYCLCESFGRAKNKGISLNTFLVNHEFSSLDLNFYRSYLRFLQTFCKYVPYDYVGGKGYYVFNGSEFSLYDYMLLFDSVNCYYNACMLREQMKTFETLGSYNYYLNLVDTRVESSPSARIRLLISTDKVFRGKNSLDRLLKVDMNCPPAVRNELDLYVVRYKQKLLPKHLNDVSNIFGYDVYDV